jgi:hypothetical protein
MYAGSEPRSPTETTRARMFAFLKSMKCEESSDARSLAVAASSAASVRSLFVESDLPRGTRVCG